MSTSIKRAAPLSPKKNEAETSSPARKVAKVNLIENEFDDDIDEAALVAAAEVVEEQEFAKAASRSSQISNTSSVNSKAVPSSSVSSGIASTSNTTLLHGDDKIESETMDVEWYERLKGELQKPYFRQLKNFLKSENAAKKIVYPPANLIYNWSKLTPLSSVKVVIVGQDPYHGPKQACGHSFSVPKGVAIPASLQNIYKELKQEYGSSFIPPKHGCLDNWAKQGVLLLNACLTVRAGEAASHHNKGWEPFTQTLLKAISQNASNAPKASIKQSTIATMFGKAAAAESSINEKSSNENESISSSSKSNDKQSKGVVFLAWGLPAAKTLASAGITERSSNILLLKSAHPSPLSAHRGFIGNGHFKAANDWLEQDSRYGKGGGIKWSDL